MKAKTKKRSLQFKTTRKVSMLCPDTIKCIALGIHSDFIKNYFDDFENFSLIVSPVLKIGVESSNGFIQKIHYRKNKYTAYTILKSSLKRTADNLYYEYLVGQNINLYIKYLPTFIETYGIYSYQDKNVWDVSKSNSSLDERQTKRLFSSLKNLGDIPELELLSESCKNSKYIALMMQYIQLTKIKQMMQKIQFIKYQILPVIFQIYAALYSLQDIFTHYDLHYENVLLYEVGPNSYIEYHYHIGGKIIRFKSPYIVKIIDYGRSYFGVGKIRDELCRICHKCGIEDGYQWLSYKKNDDSSYYIAPRFLNKSADLRFLYDIKRRVTEPTKHLSLMLNLTFINHYGTPEDLSSKPGEIRNINDAFNMICDIMVMPEVVEDIDTGVAKRTRFGDLEIFVDMSQEMRFTKAQN